MTVLTKAALRQAVRQRLSSLTASDLSMQSSSIANYLRQLPAYIDAQKIAFYMHMDTAEVETTEMIANAFEDSKRVFLPHIVPLDAHAKKFPHQKSHLQMLELRTNSAVAALEPRGKYNLKEPTEGADCLEVGGLDLIIVPGVAFTITGARVGHGAGYYDSFIQEIRQKLNSKTPKLVAVALREQIVGQIPMEPHDEWMTAVVTADGVFP